MESVSEQDSKRKAIALILMLFLGYLYLETVFKPYFFPVPPGGDTAKPVVKTEPVSKTPSPTDFVEKQVGTELPAVATPALTNGATTEQSKLGFPSDAAVDAAGYIRVRSGKASTTLSLLGGRIHSLSLDDYRNELSADKRVNLVKHIEHAPFPGGVYSGGMHDAWVSYSLVSSPRQSNTPGKKNKAEFELAPSDLSFPIVLRGTLEDGREITKTFTFYPDSYLVDVGVSLSAAPADASRLQFEWTKLVGEDESSLLDPYNISGYVWFDGTRANRQPFSEVETNAMDLTSVKWVAMGDKYFTVALLAKDGLTPARLLRTAQLYRSRLLGSETNFQTTLFMGPKSYELLKDLGEKLGYELQLTIDFGMTGVIAAPLLQFLHFLFSIFGNYGLAIVAVTILVKLILYPLNAASFKQMKALQDIKPEVDRIREHVTDKRQQQLDLMELYKKRGVNPLGGCLPILIQMPVFIALYSALMLAVELQNAPFALWITDLSAPEQLVIFGVGLPIMVILFVLSMMVQQWTTPTAMDPAQKKAMMVMPVVMGFMFMNFPAGLTLYWLTNNLISIGQQKGMQRKALSGKSGIWLTLTVCFAVFTFAFILTKL